MIDRVAIVVFIVILLFLLGRLGSKLRSNYPPDKKNDSADDS